MAEIFELLPEHIRLLRAMSWDQSRNYWPTPEVDSKRPFGNSIGVERDAAEAAGITPGAKDDWGDASLTDGQEEQVRRLVSESVTALSVILDAAERLPTGFYYRDDQGVWRFGNARNRR